jgi:hypothetical protein
MKTSCVPAREPRQPRRPVVITYDRTLIAPPPMGREQVRRVACPLCHVAAGAHCVMNDDVTPRVSNHRQRVDLAKATAM